MAEHRWVAWGLVDRAIGAAEVGFREEAEAGDPGSVASVPGHSAGATK